MLGFIARDIYDGTKRWLRDRFNKDADTPASYITIYGPDGKRLRRIKMDSADEIEATDVEDDDS